MHGSIAVLTNEVGTGRRDLSNIAVFSAFHKETLSEGLGLVVKVSSNAFGLADGLELSELPVDIISSVVDVDLEFLGLFHLKVECRLKLTDLEWSQLPPDVKNGVESFKVSLGNGLNVQEILDVHSIV